MSATAPFLPPPGTRCFRCNKDHSTAEAFLMACGKCERAWHHRCHIPPVLEQEIMGRIRADEKGKRNRGLGSWQCRLCTKKSRTEPSSVAQSAQPAIIPSTSAAHTVITIDDDDDDDIIILDGPPTQPVPTQAQLPSTLAPQHQAANDSTSPSGTSSVDHPSYGGIPARSTTLSSSSQASFSSTKPTATPDAVRPSEPSSKGKTRSLPVAIDSFGQPAPTVVSPPLGDTPTPSSEPSRMQEKGKEKERPLPRVTVSAV
ncbi:hypothetical protein C8Q76DRAFT_489964 [Earliella scabrosa]|nr:hypothetical protein C8Q76DRAFT_489964 [Earliella scabrosa]